LGASGQAQQGAALAEVHYKRGLAKLQTGDCLEAIKEFDRAIERKPNHARSFMYRGQCFDEILEIEKAIADLGIAVRLNPRLDLAFKMRGDIYAKIGKSKEAIADYTRVLKLVPNDHDALSTRADAYREIGNYSAAAADERRAEKAWELLQDDPRRAAFTLSMPFQTIRPKLLTEQELIDSYVRSIKRTELLPDSREIIQSLAREEIEKFTKILRVNPNFAGAYFDRGNNYARLGELDQAIADYSKAIGFDPNDHRSFNNRAIACARTGNYERAVADLVRAMSIEPKDASRLYNFGLVLFNQGLFQQSVNIMSAYVGRKPNDVKAYQLRALAFRKLGKSVDAENDERSARRLVDGK
jgi:tetratricopeptide (TPR) repeat protein